MRYCAVVVMLALGGCGSLGVLEEARSGPEALHFLKKESNLLSDKALGKNPYDFDPNYRMVYCARDNMQYWSTEATCLAEKGKPQS